MKRGWLLVVWGTLACAQDARPVDGLEQEIVYQSADQVGFGDAVDFVVQRRAPANWNAQAWVAPRWQGASLYVRSQGSWVEAGQRVHQIRVRLHAYAEGEQNWGLAWQAVDPSNSRVHHAAPASVQLIVDPLATSGIDPEFEWPALALAARPWWARLLPALVFFALFGAIQYVLQRTRVDSRRMATAAPSLWSRLQQWQFEVDDGQLSVAGALRRSRAEVRKLLTCQAWSGPQLAEQMCRSHALSALEYRALRNFMLVAEQAEFASPERRPESQVQLDRAWDELAIAMDGVDRSATRVAKEAS